MLDTSAEANPLKESAAEAIAIDILAILAFIVPLV
jgi:hypothetical protein